MRTSRVLQIACNYFKCSSNQLVRHNLTKEMQNNAYFRIIGGSEEYQLSFQFKYEVLDLNRQFNFSRQLSENLSCLLSRIQVNIDKIVSKQMKKKKNKSKQSVTTEEENASAISVELFCNGEPVPHDKECRDVLKNCNLLLRIFETDYTVIINAPWVEVIALPVSIMAGFPVYPTKFESVFAREIDCHFSWQRGILKKNEESNWVEVGTGYFYTPSLNDIGSNLKLVCIPGRGDVLGPPVETVSKNCVEAGPGFCPFENRHVFTFERITGQSFRVVSYNILADLYADSEVARNQLYPYCPPYALNMDYRKQLIFKELLGYNADIICLQEVDSKVFTFDLKPVLASVGYEGIFVKKGGKVSEGLACLYHTSKFKLMEAHTICLSEELKVAPIFSDLWNKIKDNKPLVARFLGRTTSVHVTVLECVDDPSKCVVVSNTHLYFHPDADHIRLLQAGMIMLYIQQILANLSVQNADKQFSTILCGDYNSTPECGIYQLMTTQFVSEDCIDWKSNVDEAVKDVSLSHLLNLKSAYGTPEFTNYTEGFSGCLDYIFYQNDSFTVEQVVPLPTIEELKEYTALPSVVFPSDHIALVADLAWIPS